jgi:hypothetical protein
MSERTQRYSSPAFLFDKDRRVTQILNIALVAMPATHDAMPLAASRNKPGAIRKPGHNSNARHQDARRQRSETLSTMTPEQAKKALALIESGDDAGAMALVKELVSSAVGGESAETPPADALADTAETPPPAPGEEEPAAAGALAVASRAVAGLEKANAQIADLTARLSAIDTERTNRDQGERLTLIGELVKLGVELPATAWQGDPEKRKPAKRLADEPIAELRARVAVLSKAKPLAAPLTPPADDAEDVAKLSGAMLKQIEAAGMTPQEFLARRNSAVRRHK